MNQMINRFGKDFSVSRSGNIAFRVKGIYDAASDVINLPPDADVLVGDIISSDFGEKFLITKVSVFAEMGKSHHIEAKVKDQNEIQTTAPATFNIETVNNSVIGNQNTITVYATIESMKNEIDSKGGADADALNELVAVLEKIAADNKPIEKGILAKFSALMEKHSWITSSVASFILSLLQQKFL